MRRRRHRKDSEMYVPPTCHATLEPFVADPRPIVGRSSLLGARKASYQYVAFGRGRCDSAVRFASLSRNPIVILQAVRTCREHQLFDEYAREQSGACTHARLWNRDLLVMIGMTR